MKQAYVDSSVWILLVEGEETASGRIKDSILSLHDDGYCLVISDAVLLEVLSKPLSINDEKLVNAYRRLFNSVMVLTNYSELFSDALTIRANQRLKSMDAIHFALALHYSCDRFLTADSDFSSITTIPVDCIQVY